MEESFRELDLEGRICQEVKERGEESEIKHFVFEDLLDTNEKLLCYSLDLSPFSVYFYLLKKEKSSLFSKEREKELGCYLGYRDGSLYTFEDLNFKIHSLEEFTLLTEAVEITTGVSFFFELCNLCKLPEKLPGELEVVLTLYSQRVSLLPPLVKFDQVADENKELLKLAVKGNEKAVEKLEREIGEEETKRLIKEVRKQPEELFDTCILSNGNAYSIVGIVTSVKKLSFQGKELTSIELFSEELEFTVLSPVEVKISEGERLKAHGKMFGIALT